MPKLGSADFEVRTLGVGGASKTYKGVEDVSRIDEYRA